MLHERSKARLCCQGGEQLLAHLVLCSEICPAELIEPWPPDSPPSSLSVCGLRIPPFQQVTALVSSFPGAEELLARCCRSWCGVGLWACVCCQVRWSWADPWCWGHHLGDIWGHHLGGIRGVLLRNRQQLAAQICSSDFVFGTCPEVFQTWAQGLFWDGFLTCRNCPAHQAQPFGTGRTQAKLCGLRSQHRL